ncbi:protein disulfide isomerase pTAC5, chloroplastic-like [Impatiens glandulifera]|uniref:protein disulfide isomerase pTAC5, chloroplastic-like n=1 Tax=Impatiens glandulifera TaxID=253017 RepID=UPI001FB12FB1|nr:protein disulfide isomerase pTAC5, chloroplastic-like [Impatiens glandulifera]
MSSSYLHLSFPLPFSRRHHLTFTPFPPTKHPLMICFSTSPSSSSSSSNYDREEARWLREEQRWLREESRWNAERESLIREISSLKLQIQELESTTASESMENMQVLKTDEVDCHRESSAVESGKVEEEVVVKEVVILSQKDDEKKKKRETLRKGSEGVYVRLMQEALQRLGFYSGEEDIEYSSFSSGTERAVKTWQASVGIREDGIMTSDLQERLFYEVIADMNSKGKNLNSFNTDAENEAAIVKEEVEDHHGVYVVEENRWEEPSKLIGKCLQCRGEGRLLCTGCDGTGEPNLEPEFMDWVEEGATCAYCQGFGFIVCDLCEKKEEEDV